MASSARQPKPQRKGGVDSTRRQSAWTGARASPTYSPSTTPRPPNSTNNSSNQNTFPTLTQTNGTKAENPHEKLLQSLSGLTGTTITLRTKTSQRYEGVIQSTNGEGDTLGLTLKDAKELSSPGAPLKDSLFIAATNIDTWASGPAPESQANAANGDTFRTDTDITSKLLPKPARELQAWADDIPENSTETLIGPGGQRRGGDDITFGTGALGGSSWDQFAANEKKFGIKTQFDEDLYTTKINRSHPDFKERERKAQQLANEITGALSSNPHIAEERNQVVDDSGADEENKYGAVVRGQNAYIPPGARKAGAGATSPPAVAPAKKVEVPKVSVNAPEVTAAASPPPADTASPAPASAAAKPPADPLPAFRDFVTNEKERLTKKKQALFKNEMDKRMAELVKFSQSFKLNKPIPDDLVSILAKDESKQQAIRDKSTKDASSSNARSIGASLSMSNVPPRGNQPSAVLSTNKSAQLQEVAGNRKSALPPSKTSAAGMQKAAVPGPAKPNDAAKASTAAKPPTVSASGKPLINMVIQAIPAFKGPKSKPAAPAASSSTNPNGAQTQTQAQQNQNNKLNVGAPTFKPTSKNGASTSGSNGSPGASASASASPKPKQDSSPTPPNPFFGNRVIKKNTPSYLKDDFNPFKHGKVQDASSITAIWPYNGKRSNFPPPPHQPPQQQQQQQHSPHVMQPMPPSIPPPPYEEDSAVQAARGYVYAYPPYGYPGQPMMAGMPPPPPGAYMPGPFMQPMPYPGMPPPNAMYPQMGQMPPQAYMQPPPGAYPPPPNGGGPRPSMPPTPIPSHAHPYYPQSPQLQHAVPYPMMMQPPPGGVPQHNPYEPQQMGGHA